MYSTSQLPSFSLAPPPPRPSHWSKPRPIDPANCVQDVFMLHFCQSISCHWPITSESITSLLEIPIHTGREPRGKRTHTQKGWTERNTGQGNEKRSDAEVTWAIFSSCPHKWNLFNQASKIPSPPPAPTHVSKPKPALFHPLQPFFSTHTVHYPRTHSLSLLIDLTAKLCLS